MTHFAVENNTNGDVSENACATDAPATRTAADERCIVGWDTSSLSVGSVAGGEDFGLELIAVTREVQAWGIWELAVGRRAAADWLADDQGAGNCNWPH